MNAVATIQAPRLPYHPGVAERFPGVDQGAWRVLTDAVFPAAERPESIIMALAYCKARNLDIFKKPVQIVPIYDKKRGGMVDTVWPGIAELRTTAMRTGSFAGFEDTAYGPMIEENLGGVLVKYPEWAQCTVYRLVGSHRVAFVGPKTFWIETYATAKRDTRAPNSMWAKRPRGQLEKCAEAAALRRAFPEEIGNEYAAEEIEGQAFGHVAALPPQPTGMRARLEARQAAPAQGFDADHVARETGAAPAHDAETGEVAEVVEFVDTPADDGLPVRDDTPADDFPGDQPAEEPKPDLPPMKTGADLLAEKEAAPTQTLGDRLAAFEGICKGAGTADLSKAWRKSADLRNALDAADPDEHGTAADLERWWQDEFDAAELREKGA